MDLFLKGGFIGAGSHRFRLVFGRDLLAFPNF